MVSEMEERIGKEGISEAKSAGEDLKRARQLLGRKQNFLDAADDALDSLLMSKPKPSPIAIARAKLNIAEAKRDVAEAALQLFLNDNPRPSLSDAVATKYLDVKLGQLQNNVAEAKLNVAEAKYDVAKAEWHLSQADFLYAQAKQASDTELEQKSKAEEVLRAKVEGFATATSPG